MKNGIYIVGGFDNYEISKLNPSTGVFENVALLDEYRFNFGICALDNENFIFAGGFDDNYNWNAVKTSYIFNTNTNTFKKLGNLNTERSGLALVKSENGDIYAIGGEDNNERVLNTIEKFDEKSQSWKNVNSKLKTARCNIQAVAYKNFIYILGGVLQTKLMTNSIEKFDTITGEVQVIKTKLNLGRCEFAVTKFKNLVYVFGGLIDDPNERYSSRNTVEIFNLDLEEIKEGKSLKNADFSFTANIF